MIENYKHYHKMQKYNRNKEQGGNKKKRHAKEYYKAAQAQSRKTNELRDGITGFMITCAGDKEKRSVKDCFNILNEALEKTHQ